MKKLQTRWWSSRSGVWLMLLVGMLLAGLLPGVSTTVARQETLRAHLQSLHVAQSRFRELVIALRHGLSFNYDEANYRMSIILANQREIAVLMREDPLLQSNWRAYEQAVQNQAQQWEDFKQRNSLVRNSLRYFQSNALDVVRTLPGVRHRDSVHYDLMALNNALFLRALGEDDETQAVFDARLRRIDAEMLHLPEPLRPEFLRLMKHARIIARHSPPLAEEVRGLTQGAARQRLEHLSERNHALLIRGQERANRYYMALLGVMTVLLAALGVLLMRYFASLRHSAREHRLAGTVFASSQQGIIITDQHGDIVQVNPAYCQITGYSEAELLGRNPRMLRSGLQDKAFYAGMWQELSTRGRWQGELKNRRRNGDVYVQWANIDAVSTVEGERLYVGIVTDISELVQTRERLASLAYFDTLTGLPNRVLFHDRLSQSLAQARREGKVMALLFCDLDNFKTVNDTLGHVAGDELLRIVAQRLVGSVRESDTVARLGGDEFALILNDVRGADEIAHFADALNKTLVQPCVVQGAEILSSASLGVTFYPNDATHEDALLKNADVAMYRAKEQGRNTFRFFTDDMADAVAESLLIESRLRRALELGELTMHFQPQIDSAGRVVGAEALMRWYSAELDEVPPSRFIPVAERCGLIVALGDFALRESCRWCAGWRKRLSPEFHVAVNISAAQFRGDLLVEQVAGLLQAFDLPGSALELEITESIAMDDAVRGREMLARLKRLGCRLAIDDFGTGYSSLAYLKRFQVDVLKIDKSFIDGLRLAQGGGETFAEEAAVARAMIGLARSLRLDVVAEGVETRTQLDCLTHLAGDGGFIAQGFYYSQALPAEDFEARYADLNQPARAVHTPTG